MYTHFETSKPRDSAGFQNSLIGLNDQRKSPSADGSSVSIRYRIVKQQVELCSGDARAISADDPLSQI
ncbi:hypothetical protein T265_01033 [Opisthorchis viverrini]|uniref:Uncharacterized protein n=1 Tax=Opisthorchis viverrini TaxID=6198 RepID=A0A075AAU7_OPIVI|nr:hypothetical protein T265_01033 [Opisthorchis viverrini]KER32940.1 hypothetical protein T265_01033 [Opisthorchis viverrini]